MDYLPFEFETPVWLWLLLLIPLVVVFSFRSLAGLERVRRVLAMGARCLVVLLATVCLAGVTRVQRNRDLTVMFLMDRSHSVQALQNIQEQFIATATQDMPPTDRVGLIDFARNALLEQRPEHAYYLQPGRLPVMANTDRTDIAAAIRLAMAMFPHNTAKRIVLMSDGNDNMGDVLAEARRAKAAGIPIDVVPLWFERKNEVYFDRMIAPTQAEHGEQVPLRMVLISKRAVSGTLAIYHNRQPVALPPEAAHVNLKAGSNTFFIRLPVNTAGAHVWEAVFQPDDDSMDGFALNNRARAFSFVEGASLALMITANPTHDRPLFEALRKERVKVDMKTPAELGAFDLLGMMNYSTIILCNLSAATFTEEQQRDLAVYVKDMGSGLIMTGGDDSFGAGGWIGTPLEEVMPVTFEVKHKRVIPRGALVVIMHSCEISRGNYWGKQMAKKSVDTISSKDYFGLIAYTWSPGGVNWEVPLGFNTNKAAVKAKIDRMQNGDMPDFGSSMLMALNGLTKGIGRDAAQKHVIILSDGDATTPSPGLLNAYKKAKVTVSTIALGWGAHVREPIMQNIARQTGGRYYRAHNPRQLPQIFVKESKVVRRPLIVDKPLQPQLRDVDSALLGALGRGAPDLPPLGGMVLTSVKPSPNVILPIVRVSDDGDDPVLAHWQYELGKTVAFTSGHWPIWGTDWTAWKRFAKFWAQVVRWTMRQEATANFETYTKIEGSRGRVVIDALDKDASYLNFLDLQSKIIGPDGSAKPLAFRQTGPGHYEAEFEAEQAGQYLANIQVDEAGIHRGTIRTGASLAYSPEFRDMRPNEALLRQVADITGGAWRDEGATRFDVFDHSLPPTEAKRPAWRWVLAWLLLPTFLLDVAVRRLASWVALSVAVELVVLVVLLFGLGLIESPWWGRLGAVLLAELIGWSIRFRSIGPLFDYLTQGVTALQRADARSEASLKQLKDARERAREELATKTESAYKRLDLDAEPATGASAAARYDVGDQQAEEPIGDLREALGGVTHNVDQPAAKPAQGDESKAQEDEDAMSRLLRAKRKRRRDHD